MSCAILFCLLSSFAAEPTFAQIAPDVTVAKDGSSASTTIASPAFSTARANELVLAFVATDYLSGTNTTVKSIAGGSLTWTLVKRTNAQSGTAEIWRTFATTPLAGVTVTATLSQSVASSITVMSFSGVSTTGTNGSGAIGAIGGASAKSGAPSASLVTTGVGSWVLGVGNDFDNATARTLAAGQTLVHQYLSTAGDTYWVQRLSTAVATAGTTVTIADTAPTKDRYNLSIVEVLATAGVAPTWTLSGTITPASLGSGTTVTLSGASSATTTADGNGNYSFTGLANGSYTVTPTKSGVSFSPLNQPVTINGANQSGVNFTAQTVTYSISGSLTPASVAAGATVTLGGTSSATTTADGNGNYSFTGLANGAYTVTPTKSSVSFSPSNQPVTISGANQSGVNFTAQTVTYGISGSLTPASVAAGATVTLGGAASATTIADGNGNYSFSGLANGAYTVTPSESGVSFSPSSQPININGASQSAVNFTAQTVAQGTVQLIQKAVNGNEGTTSSMSLAFPTANTAGDFLIVEATVARPAGTLSISDSAGNTYVPVNAPVTDTKQNVTSYLWYVATCNAGPNTVTVTPGTPGAQEIHISEWSGLSASNPIDGTAAATGTGTSASSGAITTAATGDLVYGYAFLLNPASPGAGFASLTTVNGDLDEYQIQSAPGSVSATFTQPSGTWFARVAAFRSTTLSQNSISGTIMPATSGTGATVTLSGAGSATTTADASGNYVFSGLANGSYTVTPTKAGYSFTPPSQNVVVNNAGQSGINFTAQSTVSTYTISGNISPSAGGSGATVALSGAATGTTSGDANGNFSFAQLSNGTYTITPSKNGYIFTPPSQTVGVSGADVGSVDFTASAQSSNITMDAKVSADGTAASSTIGTSAFNTASANELLLAFISTDYLSGANTTVKSVAGGGLTWTLVTRANGQSGSSEIWRAFATAPTQNISVSATLSQSVVSSITVISLAGVSTNGAGGSGAIGAVNNKSAASGAPTASLVTTGTNSWVLGVGNDFDNAVTRSVPTGQTLLHQDLTPTGDTYWVQMQANAIAAAGTTVTINDTAPTKDRYNLAIVEVLAGSGSTNTVPPTVSMTAPGAGATLAGQTTLAANASDPVAVAGVQFLLDGAPLGAEDTSAPYTLVWDTTTTSDGSHTLAARARDSAGLSTLSSPIAVTVQNSSNLAVVGQWSSVYSLPAVAVDLILLQNNKVLFYQDGSTATVWDYVKNTFSNIPTSVDLFCSGHALLSDGRVMVVGGYGESSTKIGIANAEIFDPVAETWTAVPNMQYRRWYPNATTLSDGRIMVTAGWQTTAHSNAGISEIYDPSTDSWTSLTNANNPFETYPFLYLLPDGRVIHIGGSEYATDTDILDLNTVSWSVVDANIIDGGSATMYLPNKFMKAGSATDSQGTGPSSNTTFVLDMTQPSPAWQQTASMAYPRSFLNLTMLPDGNVLATGGETDRNGGTIANAVYAAEMWSPTTKTWSTMASMHTPREYHGTAVLLPDGRVLESGMGADFGNVPDEKSAEFYSPPYLFKGARPTIAQAPAQIQYNATFFVGTPDAANIAKVSLIRTGAVTHFFDQNERYLPLTFTQTTGGLNVTAPVDANLAPPGFYMLFIVNSNGVPSIAPFVQVQ